MLDSKHLKAYNSIKAPSDLIERIDFKTTKKKQFNYKAFASVAACVLLLVAVIPTYFGLSAPSVNLSSQPIAIARAIETAIPITVETHRNTQVYVSSGDIGISTDEKINGKTELIWYINNSERTDQTLTLKDCFGTKEYTLHYNVKNDSWSIIKK